MTIGNATLYSFLLAVLIYFLFNAAIDTFVSDEPAKKIFKFILLIICILIALGGSFFIHV